jgi:hypothetical protein
MVETIVHVSHSLGICTVAESVETAKQVKILRELGADVGQGYFFAPPLAVEDALTLTTMDPLPVFPLTAPDDRDDDDLADFADGVDRDAGEGAPNMAAEVMDALGAIERSEPDRGASEDSAHVESNDVSLVSKRGRLMTFRRGRSN